MAPALHSRRLRFESERRLVMVNVKDLQDVVDELKARLQREAPYLGVR